MTPPLNNDIGINLNDLMSLAKSNPKYAELFGSISGMDALVKQMATDAIETYATDPSEYYIKTELLNFCYNMYLYNTERAVIVGYSLLFNDFLTKCQTKEIENDIQEAVKKMLTLFGTKNLSNNKVNWIS